MTQSDFDVGDAQRRFAVELNNLAWDLVEADQRSGDDVERMIHAAHASAWHWRQTGTDVHRQRALCLLANVYTSSGNAERAVHYAQQALRLSETNEDNQSEFDHATALASAAAAYRCAGRHEQAEQLARRAQQAIEALSDREEQRVASEMLQRSPIKR